MPYPVGVEFLLPAIIIILQKHKLAILIKNSSLIWKYPKTRRMHANFNRMKKV